MEKIVKADDNHSVLTAFTGFALAESSNYALWDKKTLQFIDNRTWDTLAGASFFLDRMTPILKDRLEVRRRRTYDLATYENGERIY